jgi:hypothetical protein
MQKKIWKKKHPIKQSKEWIGRKKNQWKVMGSFSVTSCAW